MLGAARQDSSCSTHEYSHAEYGVSSYDPYIPGPADRGLVTKDPRWVVMFWHRRSWFIEVPISLYGFHWLGAYRFSGWALGLRVRSDAPTIVHVLARQCCIVVDIC
ncbi:hypothetical protein M9H77_26609 [Catharanthus roseus]|uniref:Uncharacterized protein n=1 Tax=Catharanthus roseus TaxID=4058 RepID=A0ACC0AB51_CATRO|nr:hypothetical protein M9H77_26609 [Catharanthus roseus]